MEDTKLALNLNRDQELQLYLMIGTNKDSQKVIAIAGYDLESALEEARKKNIGYLITYQNQTILVKDLLNKIKQEEVIPIPPEMTKETFINSLMLVADRYTEGNDQKAIKRILSKVK